jgi:hypothetical protein
MIQIRAFKKNEKEGSEGRPQLGGKYKVPSLAAFEMNPCLKANGETSCLKANGKHLA